MLQRFAGVSGILASMGMMESVDVQKEFANLYFDIAGDPEPVALDMLLSVAGEDKIVYGSDFPHSSAKVVLAKKKHLEESPRYEQLLRKVYGENEKKCLGK